MGRPRRAFAERIVELMDLPISPAEFLDAIQSHSDEMLADANLMPGKTAYKKALLDKLEHSERVSKKF